VFVVVNILAKCILLVINRSLVAPCLSKKHNTFKVVKVLLNVKCNVELLIDQGNEEAIKDG